MTQVRLTVIHRQQRQSPLLVFDTLFLSDILFLSAPKHIPTVVSLYRQYFYSKRSRGPSLARSEVLTRAKEPGDRSPYRPR